MVNKHLEKTVYACLFSHLLIQKTSPFLVVKICFFLFLFTFCYHTTSPALICGWNMLLEFRMLSVLHFSYNCFWIWAAFYSKAFFHLCSSSILNNTIKKSWLFVFWWIYSFLLMLKCLFYVVQNENKISGNLWWLPFVKYAKQKKNDVLIVLLKTVVMESGENICNKMKILC